MKTYRLIIAALWSLFFSMLLPIQAQEINIPEPVPPPAAVREAFDLGPFYQQWIDVGGMPVVASAEVNPYAVKEAAYLVRQMTQHRPEVIQTLVEAGVRLAVLGHTELKADLPDYRGRPAYYQNVRGRVIGGGAPIINEENLLNYPGQPYQNSCSMLHEFGHTIEDPGMPGFRARIEQAYQIAVENGSWKGTYTSINSGEYWAEGTEAWFYPSGGVSAHRYGHTREALKARDPELAALLTEVYGDSDWRYTPPETRHDQPHLRGFDPQNRPRFQYPPAAVALYQELTRDPESTGDGRWVNLEAYPPGQLPRLQAARTRGAETIILFGNFRRDNILLIYSVDPDGTENLRVRLRGDMRTYGTRVGDLWLVKDENGRNLDIYRAEEKTGRVLYISEEERSALNYNFNVCMFEEKHAVLGYDDAEGADIPIGLGPGPKIEGPWLWMIAPTDGKSGPDAVRSGKDWLAAASDGSVTELQVATRGVAVGAAVGNRVWTPSKIAPKGGDNITAMVNAIGLGTGHITNHVAYGSIVLNSPRMQETIMHIGSDDSIRVWLNGVLVYTNPADRGAKDYQNNFPVTLKQGNNVLLVAIYQGGGWWSGFLGFENGTEYTVPPIAAIQASDRPTMYWIETKTGTLQRLVGSWVENIVPNVQGATSLAIDKVNEKLYWTTQTNETDGTLNRANLDGTSVQKLTDLNGAPVDIEVDGVGRKLYWIDARNRLRSSNLIGKNVKDVISNLEAPKHLALDVGGGKVYWTEAGGRIRRANLNGNAVENVATDLGTPLGLDVGSGKLFWIDRDSANVDKLRRVDLNGRNISRPRTVAFVMPGSVAIDADGGKLYLTEGGCGRITRMNFYDNRDEVVVTGLVSPGAIVLETRPTLPVVHVGTDQRPPMYWIDAEAGTLHRLVGDTAESFLPRVQNATGLVLEPTSRKMYWTEDTGGNTGAVKRANLDGSNLQLLTTLQSVPTSIAVHAANRKLYWTNARGRIQQADLNGQRIRNLLQDLKDPGNMTVDATGGKIYWTEGKKRIRRANLNGKSVQNVANGLESIGGIAIAGNTIYWTEITGEDSGKLSRANLNGSNARMLAELQHVPCCIAVDPVGSKLYWTDADGNIRSSDLNGEDVQDVASSLASAIALVLGSVEDAPAAPMNSSLVSSDAVAPATTHLLTNYPNPFNPETWIPYQLSKASAVALTIYDIQGRVVRDLNLGHQRAGVYQNKGRAAYWDGRNAQGEPVASGLYFYTLKAGDFIATRKMLIRK